MSSAKADAILEAQQSRIAFMSPRAVRAYEAFHHISFGRASEAQVARSSAGFEGWRHLADVFDGQTRGGVGGIEEQTFGQKPRSQPRILLPFDRVIQCRDGRMPDPSSQRSKVIIESQSVHDGSCQIDARLASDPLGLLIDKLGIGQEVMSKAKQALLKSGSTASRLGVLPTRADSRVNIMESDGPNYAEFMIAKESDVEFEAALDSGSQDHICDFLECPVYSLEASPASTLGGCFIVCNGTRLPNQLSLEAGADGLHGFHHAFR